MCLCVCVCVCVCRLSVCVGVVCSCRGWSLTGSWMSHHVSHTWICLPTAWPPCPLWCPGVSSACKLWICLITSWKSCQLLIPPRRSSAQGKDIQARCIWDKYIFTPGHQQRIHVLHLGHDGRPPVKEVQRNAHFLSTLWHKSVSSSAGCPLQMSLRTSLLVSTVKWNRHLP